MAEFKTEGKETYIKGANDKWHKILIAFESFSGWYWFGTEKIQTQNSVIDGKTYENDQIWFGLVQGTEEEWGDFSQSEIEALGKHRVWRIPKKNWPHSGRRQ